MVRGTGKATIAGRACHDGAGDDPPMEQPAAFLAALRDAMNSTEGAE